MNRTIIDKRYLMYCIMYCIIGMRINRASSRIEREDEDVKVEYYYRIESLDYGVIVRVKGV